MSNPLTLMVLMMVVMYFFFIRPQQKKRKEAEKFRQNLQKGDKVVTIGGIHGKVADIQESTVVISCETGKIKVDKSAISGTSMMSETDLAQNK